MTTKNNTQNVSEMKKHPVDVLIAKRRTNSVPPHMKKCSVDILIAKRRIFGTLCVGGGIGGGSNFLENQRLGETHHLFRYVIKQSIFLLTRHNNSTN